MSVCQYVSMSVTKVGIELLGQLKMVKTYWGQGGFSLGQGEILEGAERVGYFLDFPKGVKDKVWGPEGPPIRIWDPSSRN